MRIWILFLFSAFMISFVATADTFYVFPDGSGDFPTIQAAVDAAANGDVIVLGDGVFTGDGNRDVSYLGKAIMIQSQSDNPEQCRIDCQGSESDPHRAFNFTSGEQSTSLLVGIGIEGGWSVYPEYGGAIRCENGGSPSIANCMFSANGGTAVWVSVGCDVSFRDCMFTQNSGLSGGAIFLDRGGLSIVRCTFTDNESNEGGAICGYESPVEISASTFTANSANNGSVGIFHDGCVVTVRGCLFQDNDAAGDGGALTFWISGPNIIEGCTFVGNTAATNGAAIWSEKISETYIRNCTFWRNGSPDGTIVAGHFLVQLENTIVAESTEGPAVSSFYDYAELSCCDLYGNAGGDWVGSIADQFGINGNISEDPMFCDPENGDFEIHCASPCAPFSPSHPECDLTGAWPVGCGGSPVTETTWGSIKALYRE